MVEIVKHIGALLIVKNKPSEETGEYVMENYFKRLANLFERIGRGRFEALVNPDNVDEVLKFCDGLLMVAHSRVTIGGRIYEIVNPRMYGIVENEMLVMRAKEMGASLGEDDCKHIFEHQSEIPAALRGVVCFIFTEWRDDNTGGVTDIFWEDDHWIVGSSSYPEDVWHAGNRLLRRV